MDTIVHRPDSRRAAVCFAPTDRRRRRDASTRRVCGVARRVARWVHALGLTDLVRLPQRRNCLMIAPRRHPLMRRTLERIVAKFDAERGEIIPEPTKTLELTGEPKSTLEKLMRHGPQAQPGVGTQTLMPRSR